MVEAGLVLLRYLAEQNEPVPERPRHPVPYVVDVARAGQGLVALSVADLPATLAELEHREIRPDRMEDVGGGRKATVLDPDGNTVAIISVPAA